MIVDDIMPPFLKPFFLLGAKTFERMARGAPRGGAKRGGAAGRAPTRNDADEAIDDARAEIEDTTAVLDAGASAGESAGAAAGELPPAPPIGQSKSRRRQGNQREGSNAEKIG
jgi:hypothetical protein